MDLEKFVREETPEIEKALNEHLAQTQQRLADINPLFKKLFAHFIQTNRGGKRLRALLVKLGYLLAGGKEVEKMIPVMMAVEIFHTAILAHDDIIDQSPLRRGKPTIHHALGNDHHAVSQTIVLADYGFFLANQLIAESQFDSSLKIQAFQIFNSTVLDTAVGEIIDVEIPHQKQSFSQNDAEVISLFKTARYTFTGPLQIGAILGGGDKKLHDSLQQFGDDLGIAFQIQDDILGVFGQSEEMGKSNSSDLEEGKATLLAAYAYQHGTPSQVKVLQKLYGKADLTSEEADKIRQIFMENGALDFSHKTALEYTQSAVSKIDQLEVDSEYKTILRQLADFLLERKK